MLSKNEIKSYEKRYGFRPQKRLGQNFLIDANIKEKILDAAGLETDDTVLEIGAGLGQLTFEIAEKVKRLIALEFDKKIYSILSGLSEGHSNIVLAHEDFLKFDFKKYVPVNKKIKIVSDPPYYISTPIMLKIFSHYRYVELVVMAVQREVADRITARRGTKNYSPLSLVAQYHARVSRIFNISRNSFYPVPRVDSTVLCLRLKDAREIEKPYRKELFELIRASFAARRKTLINSLLVRGYGGLSRSQLTDIIKKKGVDPEARAETLSLEDFTDLVRSFISYEKLSA